MSIQDKLANLFFLIYFVLVSGTVLFLTFMGLLSYLR